MRATLTTTAPAVTCRHVDTCLSCYLLDHHNRPGELLVGVPVTRATRVHEVRAELMISAAHGGADDTAPAPDAIKAAVAACFAGAHPLRAFDRTLDAATDDDAGDTCEAWFLFTWQPAEAEAASIMGGDYQRLPDGGIEWVPVPAQQQQADAGRFAPAVHADAADWLGYVSACAATSQDVIGFDAAVTEAIDTLLRRHVITPRVAACLFTFFDVPRVDEVRPIDRLRGRSFADHAARIAAEARGDAGCAPAGMLPMPVQQQQGRAWAPPAVTLTPPDDALEVTFSDEDEAFTAWRASAVIVDDIRALRPDIAELFDGYEGGPAIVYAYQRASDGAWCACHIYPGEGGTYCALEAGALDSVHETRAAAELHIWAQQGADIMADAPIYGGNPLRDGGL